MKRIHFILSLLIMMLGGCSSQSSGDRSGYYKDIKLPESFGKYWYQGKGEISTYKLTQSRYGEQHQGHAVLVYVTEDFLINKQVKSESGPNSKSTPVLKLNALHKFPTGIYDYSMMTSVFTPVKQHQYPSFLKTSFSSQDWCGHAYYQVNYQQKQTWKLQRHSYFEAVADQNQTISNVLWEDAVWTILRLNPDALPTGDLQMVPSMKYIRLRHVEAKAYQAKASRDAYKGKHFEGQNLRVYELAYPTLERKLKIIYEKAFPHKILGWEDSHPSGFGNNPDKLTTRAVLQKSMMTPYWKQHNNKDLPLRDSLQLPNP